MVVLPAFWKRISIQQSPLPSLESWLSVAVAVAVVLFPATWYVAREALMIAHEAGHAVVATLTGRTVTGTGLHSDTSGVTVSRGSAPGPAIVLMLLAGYTSPSNIGLGASWLLGAGFATGMILALLATLMWSS